MPFLLNFTVLSSFIDDRPVEGLTGMYLAILVVVSTLLAIVLVICIMFCVALICLKQKQKDRITILKEDALVDEEVGECSSVKTLSIRSRPSTSDDMAWTVSHRPQRIRPTTAAVRVERPPESPAPKEFLPGPPIITVHSDELNNDDELQTLDESIENVIPCETPRLDVEEGADRPSTAISIIERPPEIPQLREFLAADDSDGKSVSTGITGATGEATASDSPTLIMVKEAEHPEPYDETDYENASGESDRPSTSETQEPRDLPPRDATHRVGRSSKVTPLGEASPKERPPGRLSRRPLPRGARPKQNTNNNANDEATKAEEGKRAMYLPYMR